MSGTLQIIFNNTPSYSIRIIKFVSEGITSFIYVNTSDEELNYKGTIYQPNSFNATSDSINLNGINIMVFALSMISTLQINKTFSRYIEPVNYDPIMQVSFALAATNL